MTKNVKQVKEDFALSPFGDSHSYSGCDISAICTGTEFGKDENGKVQPYRKVFKIGDIQTLTYSIHSDQGAVRVLGRRNPKSFTRGPRTIAGSLIFSVFNRRALYEISKKESFEHPTYIDKTPPFDILLYFVNEYKQASTLVLYGVQVSDEGQSHSVQDAYLENTMTYVARDIDLLEPIDESAFRLLTKGGTFISAEKLDMAGGVLRSQTIEELGLQSWRSGINYKYRKL